MKYYIENIYNLGSQTLGKRVRGYGPPKIVTVNVFHMDNGGTTSSKFQHLALKTGLITSPL